MRVFLVISLIVLSSCGIVSRMSAGFTGWSRVCVSGVSYLQFPSGVTVEYNWSGTIKQCSEDKGQK